MSVLSSGVIFSHRGLRDLTTHSPRVSAEDSRLQLIEALARTMNAREAATYEHAERVRAYSLALAETVPACDAHTIDALDHAALLHDIGKLAIPDWLLHKPGPLTADEYDHVKQHATIGADMLAAIAYPGPLALIVRHHHEHWDGSGYPDGLAGEAIPVGARILAVADFYDALTSDRPYRRAFPHDRAIGMLQDRAGRGYEPAIVQLFVTLVERFNAQPNRTVTPRFPDLVRAGWLTDARAV